MKEVKQATDSRLALKFRWQGPRSVRHGTGTSHSTAPNLLLIFKSGGEAEYVWTNVIRVKLINAFIFYAEQFGAYIVSKECAR
jgi:hypothetical protein